MNPEPIDPRRCLGRLRPFSRVGLALAAGAATVLSFAPFAAGPMAVVGPSLLFLLWMSAPPRRAFVEGWLFGVGLLGFGVSWMYISIEQFGNTGVALAVVITAGFILFTALFYGLCGWLAARLLTRTGGHLGALPLLFPAIWVSVEWLRGWVLTGFPWLSLGYSQVEGPLRGYAPLLGVYGVSWAVVLTSALLIMLLAGGRRRRITALVTVAVVWGGGFTLSRVDWTEVAGEPLLVALVQGNVEQHLKWRPEQLLPTLHLYRSLTREHWDSDLVVWPETAVPAFAHRVEQEFLRPLEEEARSHRTELLIGIPLLERESGRYYNAMLKLGEEREDYRKRHLVPFGEFMPFQALLGPLLRWIDIPMSSFSAGDGERPLLRLAGYPVGVSICYEDAFSAEVNQALPDAAFLVNASNDAWFGDSLAPHQHMEIARMRALETGRFLLRSTNTGISAIVDEKGRVSRESPIFEIDVLRGSLIPMRGLTPFSRIGHWGILSILLLVTLYALIRTGPGRRRP